MLAEEDGLGWVGAGRGWYGLECIWSVLFVLSVVYLCEGTDCLERKQLGSVWVCLGTNQTNSRVKVGKGGKYLIDRGNSRWKFLSFSLS